MEFPTAPWEQQGQDCYKLELDRFKIVVHIAHELDDTEKITSCRVEIPFFCGEIRDAQIFMERVAEAIHGLADNEPRVQTSKKPWWQEEMERREVESKQQFDRMMQAKNKDADP